MDEHPRATLLGQLLLAGGIITPEELRAALSQQEERGGLLGEILIEMGALAPRQLARALAEQARLRGTPAATGPLVLVVEDDAEVRAAVGDILVAAGYRVAVARDEAEALTASLKDGDSRPALIMLDLCLPEHGGIEILTLLRKSGATQDIPVVVLTGRPDLRDEIIERELDIAELLIKPVAARRLIDSVTAALEGAQTAGGDAQRDPEAVAPPAS